MDENKLSQILQRTVRVATPGTLPAEGYVLVNMGPRVFHVNSGSAIAFSSELLEIVRQTPSLHQQLQPVSFEVVRASGDFENPANILCLFAVGKVLGFWNVVGEPEIGIKRLPVTEEVTVET